MRCKILLVIGICVLLSGCNNKQIGMFKVVDGKELFFQGDEQVLDKLVTYDGEQYYISENGIKVKNGWAVIDNDGAYAYFGAKGMMIKNTVKEIGGDLYLFDKNGKLETNGLKEKDNCKYYATKDGVLLKNQFKIIDGKDYYFGEEGKNIVSRSWVSNLNVNGLGDLLSGDYYLDDNGQRLKNCWQDDYYLGNDGLLQTNAWVGEGDSRCYVDGTGKKSTFIPKVNEKKYKNIWSIDYYVDNFGDKTDERYIKGFVDGTLYNDNYNDMCSFKFLIGDTYVDLMIFEYGYYQIENLAIDYNITMKTFSGETYNFIGRFNNDRMTMDDIGYSLILKCLKSEGIFKLLIEPSSGYGNKYLLEVDPDNFSQVYWR